MLSVHAFTIVMCTNASNNFYAQFERGLNANGSSYFSETWRLIKSLKAKKQREKEEPGENIVCIKEMGSGQHALWKQTKVIGILMTDIKNTFGKVASRVQLITGGQLRVATHES